MAVDYHHLLNYPVPEVRQRYTRRDTQLYALGLGLGADPTDTQQLHYVYEDELRVFPTYPVVLGHPGFWWKRPDTGVDWVRIVHAEQGLILHRTPPVEGEVIGRTRVTQIVDKGPGKGLLVYTERTVVDAASGELLATLPSTTFLRGDGGIGAPAGPVPSVHRLPEREPDRQVTLTTLPQAALIYRLSGDDNPLHADPVVARRAGFERPILHGLCTMGMAVHAVLRAAADPDRPLASIQVRFTGPVYPGETLVTDLWRDGEVCSFRTRVPLRASVVLDHGRAQWSA